MCFRLLGLHACRCVLDCWSSTRTSLLFILHAPFPFPKDIRCRLRTVEEGSCIYEMRAFSLRRLRFKDSIFFPADELARHDYGTDRCLLWHPRTIEDAPKSSLLICWAHETCKQFKEPSCPVHDAMIVTIQQQGFFSAIIAVDEAHASLSSWLTARMLCYPCWSVQFLNASCFFFEKRKTTIVLLGIYWYERKYCNK